MIVTFIRKFCLTCFKIRWHEVIVTPCCVICKEYNLDDKPKDPQKYAVMTIERFN